MSTEAIKQTQERKQYKDDYVTDLESSEMLLP